MSTIDEAVAACNFGTASAVKRGRNPQWPYVPIIDHTVKSPSPGDDMRQRTESMRVAFATRQEAIACAQRTIDAWREHLRQQLARPNMRALRRQHDVPEPHANDDVIREANERVSQWPANMFGARERS